MFWNKKKTQIDRANSEVNVEAVVSAPPRIYRNKNFMKEFSRGNAIKEVTYKNDCVEVYECRWNDVGWSPHIHRYELSELPEEKISNQFVLQNEAH